MKELLLLLFKAVNSELHRRPCVGKSFHFSSNIFGIGSLNSHSFCTVSINLLMSMNIYIILLFLICFYLQRRFLLLIFFHVCYPLVLQRLLGLDTLIFLYRNKIISSHNVQIEWSTQTRKSQCSWRFSFPITLFGIHWRQLCMAEETRSKTVQKDRKESNQMFWFIQTEYRNNS